jgi:hypothetical protein
MNVKVYFNDAVIDWPRPTRGDSRLDYLASTGLQKKRPAPDDRSIDVRRDS